MMTDDEKRAAATRDREYREANFACEASRPNNLPDPWSEVFHDAVHIRVTPNGRQWFSLELVGTREVDAVIAALRPYGSYSLTDNNTYGIWCTQTQRWARDDSNRIISGPLGMIRAHCLGFSPEDRYDYAICAIGERGEPIALTGPSEMPSIGHAGIRPNEPGDIPSAWLDHRGKSRNWIQLNLIEGHGGFLFPPDTDGKVILETMRLSAKAGRPVTID